MLKAHKKLIESWRGTGH